MNTILLGNGVLSLATGVRLLSRLSSTDKLIIVGPVSRLGSATLAAAAMLNSFGEITSTSLRSDVDFYRFELSHLATRMWPKFELALIDAAGDKLPVGCAECRGCSGGGCYGRGTYVVNNTAADDLDDENFDAIRDALDNFDEPYSMVAPSSIPNYIPAQHCRATRALLIHNEGWFNPRLMIEKMEGALRRSPSVSFVDATVDKLLSSNGVVTGARLSNGTTVEGDNYLLATGAAMSDVLRASDLDLPIQRVFYGVGVSLEIKSPDYPQTHCVRTPNRGLACGLYATPYYRAPDVPNDHILVGASNFISAEPYAHGRLTSIDGLLRGAMEQLNTNFYRADLVRVNVGWRPISQDTYPLLGNTSAGNLFIASGTNRDGFHLSPLLSEYLCSLLHGEKVDERLSVFSPERDRICTFSREEAIDLAVRHQVSASYQHGFRPSRSRMPDKIRQMYRDDLEKLHDDVGATDWGIPPEMLDMYRYGHAR